MLTLHIKCSMQLECCTPNLKTVQLELRFQLVSRLYRTPEQRRQAAIKALLRDHRWQNASELVLLVMDGRSDALDPLIFTRSRVAGRGHWLPDLCIGLTKFEAEHAQFAARRTPVHRRGLSVNAG